MTLAALLDLGVPEGVVTSALAQIGLPGLGISVSSVTRGHLAALHVQGPLEAAHEPARHYLEIQQILKRSALDPAVREKAEAIFARLARAEAKVHGTPIEQVHFHEVGGLDAIADIVGIAAAVIHLAPVSVTVTPLPLGSGSVETRHGTLPIPAPATLALLEGVPVVPGGPPGELVTPTGAAVMTELAGGFGAPPAMVLRGTGYGAGSREIAGQANVVRVLAGELVAPEQTGETVRWVEAAANIDDMNPEWGPHVIERLLAEGAQDAWQEPVVMKKGRAGVKVGFLCLKKDVDRLARCLLSESTTIGVRYHPVLRVESPRRRVSVETPYGNVRIKISGATESVANIAPEFEDCSRAANSAGVPLKEVYRAALVALGHDPSKESA